MLNVSHFLLTLIVVKPARQTTTVTEGWGAGGKGAACGARCVCVTYLTVDINDILRAISYFTLCLCGSAICV